MPNNHRTSASTAYSANRLQALVAYDAFTKLPVAFRVTNEPQLAATAQQMLSGLQADARFEIDQTTLGVWVVR